MHLHCALAALVAYQSPCPPKGGCLQSGAGRWVRILFPATSRLLILLIDVSADLLTTGTGPVFLMSSVSAPASLRARLEHCQIFRHVQLLHRWRGSALPCTGSPETGEATGPSLWVPYLLLEQRILIAVLRVHLKPPPVVHPRGRAGICAGQLP
jgi:hypothetical protein